MSSSKCILLEQIFPYLNMEKYSTWQKYSTWRKRSSKDGYLGVLPKKKSKPKPEENKFMFRVFLLNGLNLTPRLHEPWVRLESAKESDTDSALIPKLGIEDSKP